MVAGGVQAQATPEAEFKKIADQFSQAWAKGDGKAIAALHSKDAVRLAGNGTPAVIGVEAIEAAINAAITTAYKGTTLNVSNTTYRRVTNDVYVGEGTYEIAGGAPPPGTPTRGQYMNTMVRQGGRWVIAGAAVMPATPQK